MLESAGYDLLTEDGTKTGRVFITVLNAVNRARNNQGLAASLNGFLLDLHFSLEDDDDMFLQNVGLSAKFTALQPRIPCSSYAPP